MFVDANRRECTRGSTGLKLKPSEVGMWMFPELSLWGFFSKERTEEKTKAILESS